LKVAAAPFVNNFQFSILFVSLQIEIIEKTPPLKPIIMKKSLFATVLLLLAGMTLKAQESNYAKTDFVPGDEIIFDDNFEHEKLGEFPLRWDLLDGYAETAQQNGRNVVAFTDNGLGQVMPLMKEKWDWLPEVFTVEFDLYVAPMSTTDEV
jgi:hypothetical protein